MGFMGLKFEGLGTVNHLPLRQPQQAAGRRRPSGCTPGLVATYPYWLLVGNEGILSL